MKQEFLNYIGPGGGSLAGYARSYKLVLYKVFFSLMDGNGMVPGYRVAEAFREFYVDRIRRGLKADIKVDSRIENINESSVQDVYEIILLNPLKHISDKGYLSRKRDSNGKEQFVLNIAERIDKRGHRGYFGCREPKVGFIRELLWQDCGR